MKNFMVLVALACVAAMNCLPSNIGDDSKYDNSTTSWDKNLPGSPFTNEQINEWIKAISGYAVSEYCIYMFFYIYCYIVLYNKAPVTLQVFKHF